MEITLPYSEIASLIERKYDKKIEIEYVDEASANITLKVKVGFIPLSPSVTISDVEASGSTISLKYDGSFGVDMIVGGALAYLANNVEGFDKLANVSDKRVTLHLGSVARLSEVIDCIELAGIRFSPDNVKIKLVPKTKE